MIGRIRSKCSRCYRRRVWCSTCRPHNGRWRGIGDGGRLKLTDKKNIDLSEPIKQLFYDISHYEKEELSLSDTLQSKLRPYQIKGVQWLTALKNHHLSGVLADDMGLGKTLEMIAFLSQYDEKKPNLIITPKSLTFNWEDEFHHWVPDAKVVVLSLDKEERHSLISQIKKDETVNYIISYDSPHYGFY